MWSDLFRRWLDAFYWWLPRERSSDGDGGDGGDRKGATPASAPAPETSEAPRQPTNSAASGDTAAPRESTAQPEPAPTAPRAEGTADADDLTVLKGIGPAMQEKLQAEGIHTFRDLATCNPEALTAALKARQVVISRSRVEAWTKAAAEHT